MFVYFTPIAAESDHSDKCCDDIIGQSLMLAHNAVHSSPGLQLMSHVPCQGSQDMQSPVCKPFDDHHTISHDQYNKSHDQNGSHDQQMDSYEPVCQSFTVSHDSSNKPCGTLEVVKSTATTITTAATITTTAATTSIPSKITFIDWTEVKRKHVASSHYPSTPTPLNIKLDQDSVVPALSSKKKRSNNNPTVSMNIYLSYYCMAENNDKRII